MEILTLELIEIFSTILLTFMKLQASVLDDLLNE